MNHSYMYTDKCKARLKPAISKHTVWCFVRLGEVSDPVPCFMRRCAVGCCSVWDASQYGRSVAFINADMAA